MKVKSIGLCVIILFSGLLSCEKEETPDIKKYKLKGVLLTSGDEIVFPAFIIESDNLLYTFKENNRFSIELEMGNHELVFSALGYEDERISITIENDIENDVILEPGSETGRVFGELQDSLLFEKKISANPDLSNQSPRQLMDGFTGATILEDLVGDSFKQAQIFIGDSLLGYGDIYGQYWFRMQCGTYPLRVVSSGYKDKTQIVEVLSGEDTYLNFFMGK